MTNKMPEVGRRYTRNDGLVRNFKCTKLELREGKDCSEFVFAMKREFADFPREYNIIEFEKFKELPSETKEEPKSQEKDEVQLKDLILKMINVDDLTLVSRYGLEAMRRLDKVQVALEELKREIVEVEEQFGKGCILYGLPRAAQNLVDALEKIMPIPQYPIGKVTYGEGFIKNKEEKPESIWKSVQELPNLCIEVLMREHHGEIRSGYFGYGNNQEGEATFFALCPQRRDIDFNYRLKPYSFKEWCYLTDFINHIESLEERIKKLEGK